MATVARKSQLFLNSVIPVTNTHDDVVRDKLKPGKFCFTLTGFIKILSVLMLIMSMTLMLSYSFCDDDNTYKILMSVAEGVTAATAFILYVIFAMGWVIKHPGTWVKIDICLNLLLGLATAVICIVSNSSCSTRDTLRSVPGPLGITGAALLIVGCASLFLLYRYREDEEEDSARPPVDRRRKSIFEQIV